jgi:transcriptional regulator with XRE-family HTH domain
MEEYEQIKKKDLSKDDLELIDRIQIIIDDLGIALSVFAQKVEASPAAIYQVLKNKRNIPSVNVIKKILLTYSQFNSDWLLFGIGPKYKKDVAVFQTHASHEPEELDLFNNNPAKVQNNRVDAGKDTQLSEYSQKKRVEKPVFEQQSVEKQEIKPEISTAKKIDKIMIFYSDNTFMSFSPEQ